jgi:ribosomal protein S18 acetylase RimI-like enzyme
VRTAQLHDADVIAAIHVRSWQHAYRGHMPQSFLDQLDVAARAQRWRDTLAESTNVVFLSESAERVTGFLNLRPSRDPDAPSGAGEIAGLYVEPDDARQGHGSALLTAALGRARALAFTRVTLWVLSGNAVARAFYEGRSFRPDGAEKQDDRWGDFTLHELRYELQLPPR